MSSYEISELADCDLASFSNLDILDVDKSRHGESEQIRVMHNLYGLARSNALAKRVVVNLSNHGFYMISHKNGVSRFCNAKNKKQMDLEMPGLEFFDGLYYSVQAPEGGVARLLFVFSSVADFPYNASIKRRCFFGNFQGISKYVPYDVGVVRISDIGGVVGSFYMDNNYDLQREARIQNLIAYLLKKYAVSIDDAVFYGTSKGGTGALLHGVLSGVNFVAVDPIVSDEHHENSHNDSHFTQGTFPVRKKDRFSFLFKTARNARGYVVTSSQSPCYPYIENSGLPFGVSLLNVWHRGIKDHPDVGPSTINLVVSLLNSIFYGVEPVYAARRNFRHLM